MEGPSKSSVNAARHRLAALIDEWTCDAASLVPAGLRIDAHCHLGVDIDGSSLSPEQLVAQLDAAAVQAAFVAPLHQAGSYDAANQQVRAWAMASERRMHALHRVDPRGKDPASDARHGLESGAVGIKLHPRAEQFSMDHPAVHDVIAVAHEARAPVLIHAGRGMPALGPATLSLARRFDHAPLILAHAAVSDLAWIVEASKDVSNLMFDTSWWVPVDVRSLLEQAAPERVLFASDPPYGTVGFGLVITARVARAAGWDDESVAALFGGNALGLLDARGAVVARAPADRGSSLVMREGCDVRPFDRAATYLASVLPMALGGASPDEMLELASHALRTADSHELAADAAILRSAVESVRTMMAAASASGDEALKREAIIAVVYVLAHAATPELRVAGIGAVG